MDIYLNEVTGIADAITTLFFSRRSWTREKEEEIRRVCDAVNDRHGRFIAGNDEDVRKYNQWMGQLMKFGQRHITMLRFIDFSFTVQGMHRAGQDDWDSHAKRFENRIIRSSTRLADFGYEMSDWYKGKIIPTDLALASLGIELPETLEVDGQKYIKRINGYVREDCKDDRDVKRGLYMLSIPSDFIFKVNLTEFSHVAKERNGDGTANPEVKLACETMIERAHDYQPSVTRELLLMIKN